MARQLDRERRRVEMQRRERVAPRTRSSRGERPAPKPALAKATALWSTLPASSKVGEAYLESRGVAAVRERGVVRFAGAGDVAIALRTADGEVINVVRRRVDGGEPKVRGLSECPTAGTFVDCVADIVHGRDVVLVEGLFDALTARLAWPNAVVLGAHGAGNIGRIAESAVRRIELAGARLLLVPHADEAGDRSNARSRTHRARSWPRVIGAACASSSPTRRT